MPLARALTGSGSQAQSATDLSVIRDCGDVAVSVSSVDTPPWTKRRRLPSTMLLLPTASARLS